MLIIAGENPRSPALSDSPGLCVTEMSDFEVQSCSSVTERFEKALVNAVANVLKISTVSIA